MAYSNKGNKFWCFFTFFSVIFLYFFFFRNFLLNGMVNVLCSPECGPLLSSKWSCCIRAWWYVSFANLMSSFLSSGFIFDNACWNHSMRKRHGNNLKNYQVIFQTSIFGTFFLPKLLSNHPLCVQVIAMWTLSMKLNL